MANEVKVVFAGDATALEAASKKSEGALDGVSRSVDQAGKKMHDATPHTHNMADATDRLATKSSTAYGAVGALGSGFDLLGKNQPTWMMPVALGFDAMSGAMDIATLAQEGLNLAWLASPITWIIVAIVAVVAIFVLLWNKCDGFRKFFTDMWDKIKKVLQDAWEKIKPKFEELKEKFSELMEKVNGLWLKIQPVADFIGNILVTAFKVLIDILGVVLPPVFDALIASIGFIIDGVSALIGFVIDLPGYFKNAWNNIKLWTGEAKDWIVDKFNAVIDFFGGIPDFFRDIFNRVKDFITAPFRAAFNFVADAWNNTIGKLSWSVPDWVPFIGGNTISVPKLPHFHTGGLVPGSPGQEVLAILQAGERVIPVNQASSGGGDTYNITVNGNQFANGDSFDTWLSNLRNNKRRGLVNA